MFFQIVPHRPCVYAFGLRFGENSVDWQCGNGMHLPGFPGVGLGWPCSLALKLHPKKFHTLGSPGVKVEHSQGRVGRKRHQTIVPYTKIQLWAQTAVAGNRLPLCTSPLCAGSEILKLALLCYESLISRKKQKKGLWG